MQGVRSGKAYPECPGPYAVLGSAMHRVGRLLVVLVASALAVVGVAGVSVAAMPQPIVASVLPTSGPVTGGNTVTISGSGFVAVSRVMFGPTPGTGVRVLSTTKLTVIAPKHDAGVVNILVTGAGGTSVAVTADHYTYVAPPAVRSVTGASGASGSTNGSNVVIVTGTGFTGVTRVIFGFTPGTGIRVLSPTRLTVVAPKRYVGVVNVLVTGMYGTSTADTADRYTFVAPPAVRGVTGTSAANGSTDGGNTVTITGTGFTKVTAVIFGFTPGTGLKVLSSTKLTVVAPKRYVGVVNVLVTGTYGTSTAVTADRYTFVAPPAIKTVAPNGGTFKGGNTVTITGTGFTKVTRVIFGFTPGTAIKVLSSTKLTVVAPKRYVGEVNVSVTGIYGTSPGIGTDLYWFVGRPTVLGVNPGVGTPAGGNTIHIYGSGFVGVTDVRFGSTRATSFSVIAQDDLTVRVPAHIAGLVDITITGVGGTSAARASDRYDYVTPLHGRPLRSSPPAAGSWPSRARCRHSAPPLTATVPR